MGGPERVLVRRRGVLRGLGGEPDEAEGFLSALRGLGWTLKGFGGMPRGCGDDLRGLGWYPEWAEGSGVVLRRF